VSRAGLKLQAADLPKLVRMTVDKALNRSRATLIRQLIVLLADNSPNRGRELPPEALGHAPPSTGKYLLEHG